MNVDLPACIAGRKDAWDQFVRASAPVIYAAVRKAIRGRGGIAEEIADRVQDVYVRLLREDSRLLRTFDPNRAALSTWLTLIARTVVHEHMRKRRMPMVSLNGHERSSSDPAPALATSPIDDQLPINMLSAQQRSVLEMLFNEGLTVEQAAARLGVEAQTIRSAKHKALTRLREHLGLAISSSRGYAVRQPANTEDNIQ